MKFGQVDNPQDIDFTLPKDHPDTHRIFTKSGNTNKPRIFVGCAKWNKTDLKNFYPKGTKDELAYYSKQFNAIELNATFYRIFPPEQFAKWREKTPDNFRFFPKLNQEISHYKTLVGTRDIVDRYLNSAVQLDDKLGTVFLQMHNHFGPKHFEKLIGFIEEWPKDVALTVELRNAAWYNDQGVADELCSLLEANAISHTLVDTAGRRDLMHMRMTSTRPFIRYVGANHESDYSRLDQWVARISEWEQQGVEEIDFFIHQNLEKESPMLAKHFIARLNHDLGYDLTLPNGDIDNPATLF